MSLHLSSANWLQIHVHEGIYIDRLALLLLLPPGLIECNRNGLFLWFTMPHLSTDVLANGLLR